MSSTIKKSPTNFYNSIHEKFGGNTRQLYRTDNKPIPELKDDMMFQKLTKSWIVLSIVFSIIIFFLYRSNEEINFEVNGLGIIKIIVTGFLTSAFVIIMWRIWYSWVKLSRSHVFIISNDVSNIEMYRRGLKVKYIEKNISISNSDEEFAGILTSRETSSTHFRDEKTLKYDTTTVSYIISKKPFKECTTRTIKNHCFIVGEMVEIKDVFGEETEVKIGDEVIPNEKIVFIQ